MKLGLEATRCHLPDQERELFFFVLSRVLKAFFLSTQMGASERGLEVQLAVGDECTSFDER